MTAVMLTCTEEQLGGSDDDALFALRSLRRYAELASGHAYRLVNAPEQAEVILFVEGHFDGGVWGPYLEGVRSTDLYRRHRKRCVVFCGTDRPIPLVPGIYPSIPSTWHWRSLTRGGTYITEANPHVRHVPLEDLPEPPRWLASFMGCAGRVRVRLDLSRVVDERLLVRDNTEAFVSALRERRTADVDALKRDFVDVSLHSKFVLCPRGAGTASIRLFEAMQMGRAPVIPADDWVAPEGPDWRSFSLRVLERDVQRLGAILREREAEAAAMGRKAQAAWRRFYAPDALFDTIMRDSVQLVRRQGRLQDLELTAARLQFLHPYHLRQLWRAWKSAHVVRRASMT